MSHALLSNDPANRIRDAAEALEPRLVAMRRDIHAHPELAFEETRTAGIVAAELARLGISHRTGVGRTSDHSAFCNRSDGVVGLAVGCEANAGDAAGSSSHKISSVERKRHRAVSVIPLPGGLRTRPYIWYSIKYTITPVTETYSHNGSVHRAMRRCLSNFSESPNVSVAIANGTTVTASGMCVKRMKK